MVHISYALYLQKYKKNRPMEMAQLALAERKVCCCHNPVLDKALIYPLPTLPYVVVHRSPRWTSTS